MLGVALILIGGSAGSSCTGASATLPAAECGAWQDIFDTMGGRDWKQCNRLGRTDPCSCGANLGIGALCTTNRGGDGGDNATHVRAISLDSNNVRGSLPGSIGGLGAQLTSLSMYASQGSNRVSGTLPDGLRRLTGLRLLALECNTVSGSLPPWIAELTGLQILDLELNALSGSVPASVASMASLLRLDLLGNKLHGALPELPWVQYTSGCWLGGNNFSCPLPPGAATNCTGYGKSPPTCV